MWTHGTLTWTSDRARRLRRWEYQEAIQLGDEARKSNVYLNPRLLAILCASTEIVIHGSKVF